MTPTTAHLPDPAPTCVPYAEATSRHLALALSYVVQELGLHFPQLSFPTWTNELLRLKPDLWVEGDAVYLDYEDLTRLTQRLSTSPELPPLDPPIYNSQACYLARRLVKFQDQALHALTEIEAAPRAYGGSVLALVLDLAAGNGIAQQVYRVTQQQDGRPGWPDPAAARQAAGARIEAVRAARGELASTSAIPGDSTSAPASLDAEAGQ